MNAMPTRFSTPMNRRLQLMIGCLLVMAGMLTISVETFGVSSSLADTDTGLIAYYSFDDGTATDNSGKGHTGIIFGNPEVVDSREGKGIKFDGVDDYVEIANSPDLNPNQITITAWVNPFDISRPVVGHKHYMIINKEEEYEVAILGENQDSGVTREIAYAFNGYYPWYWQNSGHFANLNNFVHIAVTFDPSHKATFYINGVKTKELQYPNGISAVNSCLRIAARGCSSTYANVPFAFFNGVIDEVRIYDRALNESEIQAIYHQNCETSLTTGLDGCLLQPGDMLFVRGTGTFESLIKLGSWWSHVAMYVGNGKIVQAVPNDNSTAAQIAEIDIKQSDWWRSDANTYVQDWLVLRPNTTYEIKLKAVADAKRWAGIPELPYEIPVWDSMLNTLNDETQFYCSKLVWRSYVRNGYDLDITRWQAFGFAEQIVTPYDLANSRSSVVQRMQHASWRMMLLTAPEVSDGISSASKPTPKPDSKSTSTITHIMLIDPVGRRTGYDSSTSLIHNEIPNALYEGFNTPFENVSVIGADGMWRVVVTGIATGNYQLGAEYVDTTAPLQQRLVRTTTIGTIETFIVSQPNGVINDSILTPQRTMYIPMIHR